MGSPAIATSPDRALVLRKALLRAADIMGLSQADLARILGLSQPTVSRLRSGRYQLDEQRKEWELAILLIRLYRGLDALMASDETALRAWIHNPNAELGARPGERIASVTGLVDVLDYVDAYRARV